VTHADEDKDEDADGSLLKNTTKRDGALATTDDGMDGDSDGDHGMDVEIHKDDNGDKAGL
jgi:hypothetical protein